jgi:uncharacterized protein YceK
MPFSSPTSFSGGSWALSSAPRPAGSKKNTLLAGVVKLAIDKTSVDCIIIPRFPKGACGMRKAAFLVALGGCAICAVSGCGTFGSCLQDNPDGFLRPYGGVETDLKIMKVDVTGVAPGLMMPLWPIQFAVCACDLPLSAALDTAMLPITLPYSIIDASLRSSRATLPPFVDEEVEEQSRK